MGMPYFAALPLIKEHKIHVFSSNYTLYGEMSRRVMQVLEQFAPQIEYYSIDEAFLKLDGIEDIEAYAKKIRETVLQWTGIPVSIGIANTKTLAKVANIFAKKNIHGVYHLQETERENVLKETMIEDIWGIGRKWSKYLRSQGVVTAYNFIKMPDSWVRKHLKIIGLKTVAELKGVPCIALEDENAPKKSITVSRSFSTYLTTLDSLKEVAVRFTSRAAEKLRGEGQACQHITVYIRTNPHAKDKPYYSNAASINLSYATDYTPDLIRHALKGLESIFKNGYSYKKLAIYLSNLQPKADIIHDLFIYKDNTASSKLMTAMDSLNKKMGQGTVFYAGAGLNPLWPSKSDMRSPNYTSNWLELVKVK
jgi:DNA polymerase V